MNGALPQKTEILPVTSDEGRCRLHRAAPAVAAALLASGMAIRHGERTKAAIAERQKFSALLKMLRAGLT